MSRRRHPRGRLCWGCSWWSALLGAVVATNCFYHRYADASTPMPVTDFYDRHPISEAQVLDAVRRRRGHAQGALTPEDLFPFDQDHYGGLAAVDTLARLAGITERSRVLDLCAGLGGPARFVASRRHCRVVALEINAGRATGARRLSGLVGLGRQIRVVR